MKPNNTLVYLADDDPEDRLFFSLATKDIKGVAVNLQMFEDGVFLMDELQNNEVLPNIIFLDLNMPRKNGRSCLSEIRENPRYDNVSVAIYSTSDAEDDIEETFIAGANVYVNKPDDLPTLRNVVHKIIKADLRFSLSKTSKETFLLKI